MTVEELIDRLRCMRSYSNVSISIDTSTGESDSNNRVFSDDIIGVQQDDGGNVTILCEDGYKNFEGDI